MHAASTCDERLLIVNADDLGLTPAVTRGILELASAGAVTSASLMPNMPGCADALRQACALGLDIGVHLNICVGHPLSPPHLVRSLLKDDHTFARAGEIIRRRFSGRIVLQEVEREWSAQIEALLAAGCRPSHLDSHCHLHALGGLYELYLRLARRYNIPGVRSALAGYVVPSPVPFRLAARLPRAALGPLVQPDHFGMLTRPRALHMPRGLLSFLSALPPGLSELVCHPGYVDDELRRLDPLTDTRTREKNLLVQPGFRRALEHHHIRLVSWAEATGSAACRAREC